MESLQQLSNGSFSSRWSINIADDGLHLSFDTPDNGPFIEIDPDFFSMRWNGHNFDFSITSFQAPVTVQANQVFSNGLILPLHLVTTPPKGVAIARSSDSVSSDHLCFDSSRILLSKSGRYGSRYFHGIPSGEISSTLVSSCSSKSSPPRNLRLKLSFFRNCVKPLKMLQRCLGFLAPSLKKGLSLACSKPVGESGGSVGPLRTSGAFDSGTENRICDAVLHCKKSIDKFRKES